jgi:prepilin-type N-terminal cleavage/methylation domain-containing protein
MKNKQTGFSLIELLIVLLVLGVVAVIAIPNLLAARRFANEGSAIASLRVLHQAQTSYQATNGNGDFAGTDSAVGDIAGLTILRNGAFIDDALGGGTKSSYAFVGAITLRSGAIAPTFFFSANPGIASGVTQTGARRFAMMQDGPIRFDQNNLGVAFDRTTAPLAQALDN